MNNCARCGEPVRLRALRVTLGRRPGTANWIEHAESTKCGATDGWQCHKFKSDKKEPRPAQSMMDRWNAENPGTLEDEK